MGERQFSTPVLIDNGKVITLRRIEFDDAFRDEDWLQDLLFSHPELIPFEEIDPLFRNSVPVAREVESGCGPIDILYVNPDGLLTLVETKLWRNPESRREVVAQIINYAAGLSKMTYEQLAEVIDAAAGASPGTLVSRARAVEGLLDQRRFHDGLSQNLKHGRFLLLIAGDGIREDVDGMAEFLHTQPQLGFSLRLIEMAMFRLGDGEQAALLVQPNIVARTREVVRAVVEVRGDRVIVETPPETPKGTGSRINITNQEFFAELARQVKPDAVRFAQLMVDCAGDHGLTVQWMQAGPVFKFVDQEKGVFFTLFQLDTEGGIGELSRFSDRCKQLDFPQRVWVDYFDAIVRLVPGSARKHFRSKAGNEWDDVVFSQTPAALEPLLSRKVEWLAAVDSAVASVQAELSRRAK